MNSNTWQAARQHPGGDGNPKPLGTGSARGVLAMQRSAVAQLDGCPRCQAIRTTWARPACLPSYIAMSARASSASTASSGRARVTPMLAVITI